MRTVLVGSSLNPACDGVLRAAAGVARAMGARLHLAHAFPFPLGGLHSASEWATAELLEEQRRSLLQRLRRQAEAVALAGREIAGLHVEQGPEHRALVETARQVGADLIVVGGGQTERPFAPVLGSTVDRVIRKATCPVLVVRGQLAVPPRVALLPVDLSPLAADALRCGLTFLAGLAGSDEPPRAEALLVVHSLLARELALEHGVAASGAPEMARRALQAFLARHARGLPAPVPRVMAGEVVQTILEVAAETAADLVVMGTHGRSGFERFLLGSAAAGVVRRAPCSVLVVPPEAALKAALARDREVVAAGSGL